MFGFLWFDVMRTEDPFYLHACATCSVWCDCTGYTFARQLSVCTTASWYMQYCPQPQLSIVLVSIRPPWTDRPHTQLPIQGRDHSCLPLGFGHQHHHCTSPGHQLSTFDFCPGNLKLVVLPGNSYILNTGRTTWGW